MPNRIKQQHHSKSKLFVSGSYPPEAMLLVGNNIPTTGGLLDLSLANALKKR